MIKIGFDTQLNGSTNQNNHPFFISEFIAPLTHSLVAFRGAGSQTLVRATTATTTNNDGYLVTCLSGEIPIKGGRRVDNLIRLGAAQSATLAVAANVTMTLPAGQYVFSMGVGTGRATFSGTGGATGTLDASASGRVSVSKTITAGTLVVTASVATLVDLQVESVDAQTTKTAGEYVSVGALDYRSTQDPLCLSLPGTAGHYASTSDSVANSINGNFTGIAYLAAADYTPGSSNPILGKRASGNSFQHVLDSAGKIHLYWWDATVLKELVSSEVVPATDGLGVWVKYDVSFSAGTATGDFYYAVDNGNPNTIPTFTTLGTQQTTASNGIDDTASALYVGADGSGGVFLGKIYRVMLYKAGVLVADFNPHRDAVTPTGTITSSTTSEVWTINGASSVVRNQNYWGAGVDGVEWKTNDSSGNPIATATLDGAEVWPAGTQILATADIRDMTTANWVRGATMTRARTSVGYDGAANSATRLTGGAVAATNTCYLTVTAAASSRTYSAMVKRVTGTGPVRIVQTGTETDISAQLSTTGYALVELNASVLNVAIGFKIDTNGDAIDVDFNQFESGAYATSRMAATGAARNASVISVPTASNIASAAGCIALEYTPQHAPSGTVYLWGTYVDANNGTAILHDATNLIFRKRIAGVNYDATIANTFVSGTTYKMAASHGASGLNIALGGTLGTPHANTTAAQIGTTMQTGGDGNSASQPGMAIKNVYIGQRELSTSDLTAMTR